MTPEQLAMRARLASHTSWSLTEDRPARTAPARRASPTSLAYWDARHPDDPAAAVSAHKAYMTGLALKSSLARARRAKGGTRA